MSPDPPPESFGRTPAAAVRAALWLTLLGSAVVIGLSRYLTRPGSPLASLLGPAAGWAVPAVGVALVAALAAFGCWQAVRTAQRFHITQAGLEVRGTLGTYVLEWTNIQGAAATATGGLGLRVKSREAVIATHRGTEQQREWLRTAEPYGEWDYFFARAELGYPADRIIGWLQPYLAAGKAP
jgi:hypothetical protein